MLRTPRGNTMLGMAFSRRLWLQSIAISSAMASTLDANAKEHCYTDSILAKTKSVRGRRCCRALLPYTLWVWFYNRDKNLHWVKYIFCAPYFWSHSLKFHLFLNPQPRSLSATPAQVMADETAILVKGPSTKTARPFKRLINRVSIITGFNHCLLYFFMNSLAPFKNGFD